MRKPKALSSASRGSEKTRYPTVTVLGLDPGLSSTGYAVAEVDPIQRRIARVVKVGIIQTEPQKSKLVRKTSDDLRRAKVHAEALQRIISEARVTVVAIEMSTRTPHKAPTFSFGVMTGIAASLGLPTIEVLPHEVKAVTGDKCATKAQVIAWALKMSGKRDLGWPTSARSNSLGLVFCGKNVTKAAEHPADALAAVQAALLSEQLNLAVGLFALHE